MLFFKLCEKAIKEAPQGDIFARNHKFLFALGQDNVGDLYREISWRRAKKQALQNDLEIKQEYHLEQNKKEEEERKAILQRQTEAREKEDRLITILVADYAAQKQTVKAKAEKKKSQ